jgi:hypothetical protein
MDATGLFAPFENHDLCLWFYFLSVIGFILLIIGILSAGYNGLFAKNKTAFVSLSLYASVWYFIFYFQNRLLYTMCVKSV